MMNREQMIDEIAMEQVAQTTLDDLEGFYYDSQYATLSDLDDLALQAIYDELEGD